MTAADWAPYGIGEPDAEGWYPDYRAVPAELLPDNTARPAATADAVTIDASLLALVENWRIVVAELAERGVDLYDPVVLARPWPGVRTLIFSLIDQPTRLRQALTRKG